MTTNPTDFQRVVDLLTDADIEFVVIGGLAATVHGSAYVTYDVDLCYHRTHSNIERLCNAIAAISPTLRGAPKDIPFRFDPRTVLAGLNFTLDTDLGPLDLLGEVAGLGEYPELIKGSEMAQLFGRQVWVLGLEALITAKRAAGRSKDLLLIPELEALLEMRNQSSGS